MLPRIPVSDLREPRSSRGAILREPQGGSDRSSEEILDWLPRRGRWIGPGAVLLGFLVGLFVGLDALGLLGRRSEPPAQPAAPAVVSTSSQAAPTPAVKEVAPPSPQPQAPPPQTASPKRRAAEPASLVLTEVNVRSEPAGAMVWVDGKKLGETPLTAFFPAGKPTHLRFTKAGFAPATAEWSAGEGNEVQVQLTEAP